MKPIANQFTYDKYEFTLIARQGRLALFAKTKPHHSSWSFEVVLLRIAPAVTFPDGTSYPEREAMPKSEEWGMYGWTPYDFDSAVAKFRDKVIEHGLDGTRFWQHERFESFRTKVRSDSVSENGGSVGGKEVSI